MKPVAGTPVSLVAPPAPIAVKEAVKDAAGKVDEIKSESASGKTGESSSSEVDSAGGSEASASEEAPAKKHEPDKEKKGWIEIVLKDEDGTPQGGTRYVVTLPDGSKSDGTLDAKGKARIDGFDSGSCKVTFPELDQKVWKAK